MSQPDEFDLLIVDDNEMNRDILRRHLKRQGYKNLILAENGEEAIKIVDSQKLDLILLDIMMPEINGYQVLEYVKSQGNLNQIPVIMISALNEIDSVVKCIEMGAEDYLTKPFDPILLKARVSACLEKKRLRDQDELRREQLEEANQKLAEANYKLAEVNEKLELLTKLDGLTGIANRRHFDYMLQREWKAAARDSKPFSLIIFDIDCFKQYNDCYGHLAGDDCLRQVAQFARDSINRPKDMVARFGGEEFAIILPDTDEKGAEMIAEKICKGVAELKIKHEQSKASEYVTISLGIAVAPIVDLTSVPDDLIAKADKALYQAKQQGRNQVKSWVPSCIA